jgi:serine/threonine-protein kinase
VSSADVLEQLRSALVAQYSVEREIGRGGMATVFLAHDRKLGRAVALKVLHADLAASLGPARFRREIAFAAQLQHPHVLTVHDSGETPTGLLWFTMPYVNGESLRTRLRRERQLSVDEAVRLTREVAQALEHAHRHGVIHRDVKPENILLTADGQAVVADFGIARALAMETGEHNLTGTGVAIGTPGYMSPEQASGDRGVDARTDVYSLGAVCYEMLAGELPFTGPTPQAILAKVLSSDAPSVRRARPTVPIGIDAAIQKAMHPVPADRFSTPREFARTLEAAERSAAATLTGEPSAASGSKSVGRGPVAPVRQHDHPGASRRVAAGVALALGFLVGIAALFAWRSHNGSGATTGPVRIAVLPFENIGDSSDAYFADGLTDAVRGKLTTVRGLAVIATGSSSHYRHTEKSPQTIAQELGGVRYLLVGKVRWAKSGNGSSRVQVSPALVDATTGTDTWEQPFDAPFQDVFEVQSDIAGRVVQALGVALSAGARQTFAERPTANFDAYDEFLKGEALMATGYSSVRLYDSAAHFYQAAIALDSGFAPAWARLAVVEASAYFVGSTTPGRDSLARMGVERARALAPTRADTYLAAGYYDGFIRNDNARALSEFDEGLAVGPSNVRLLTAATLVEQNLGRWDDALAHSRQAQSLDPRDVVAARRLATTYLWLHRYSEAAAAADRGLAIAPDNVPLIQTRAMVPLAQGDLAGARAVTHGVPSSTDTAAMVAYFGRDPSSYWVLDDAQQRLLLTLPVSAFGDRSNWATVRAETFAVRGDQFHARAYADSARQVLEPALRATPEGAQVHAAYGLVLAYLGRKADAIREGERATAIAPIAKNGYTGPYYEQQLARTYVLVGEQDKAIDALTQLLKVPYWATPAALRIDPSFAPLRNNPKFQALVAAK